MTAVKYYFEHEGSFQEILLEHVEGSIRVESEGESQEFRTRFVRNKSELEVAHEGFKRCAVTQTAKGFWVTVGGETLFLPMTRTKPRKRASGGGGAPTSPMPGVVVRVEVAPDQQVEEGDALVVVEAMKMEHVIRAAFTGTITNVLVSAGDRVDGGQELIQLEKAEVE